MSDSLLTRIARAFGFVPETPAAPAKGGQRMYANAIPSRTNSGFPSFNTSADAELITSLRNLRSRSRQLVRDAGFAKNAKRIVVNNVIGTGIRIQAAVANTRGGLNERVNDAIEDAFADWSHAENCHTGGGVHFHDLERILVGQVFEAGEVFVRLHRRPFGESKVPLALEIIEPERIVEGYAVPGVLEQGAQIRMGIEVDSFRRPLAYWVRDLHPGDIRLDASQADKAERVPAADIIHLKITDRWPQTRGEPWLHAAAGKLQDMNGYSEAEIIAARGSANFMATIETPEAADALGDKQPDGSFQMPLEPGSSMRLLPGEKMNFIAPNRPNAALDPFMRFMLREVASAVGVSYESLSRDYSQSNYSSSRLALLDDRDVWKALQQWFIRSFRVRLHREWLTAAVMARAIDGVTALDYGANMDKFQTVLFRPRGWSWIDPTKEVAAFKEAVKAGFTTVGDVIGATSGGSDLEDVLRTREGEVEFMKELNLAFDTSPEVYVPAETRGQMVLGPDGVEPAAAAAPAAGAPGAPGQPAAAPAAPAKPAADDEGSEEEPAEAEGDDERAIKRRRRLLRIIRG